MDIDAAGDAGLARGESAGGSVGRGGAGREVVAEAPEMRLAGGPKGGPVTPQALDESWLGNSRTTGTPRHPAWQGKATGPQGPLLPLSQLALGPVVLCLAHPDHLPALHKSILSLLMAFGWQ
jgi:hypothetical protein